MIHFCYDDMGEFGLGYPNLARKDIEPWQFDDTWPRTVPLRLLLYLQAQGTAYQAHLVADAPVGAWYPIAMAWHDFECDYLGLLAEITRQRVRNRHLRLLFYYHEGDNPARIIQHLRDRCQQHDVPADCFLLVSANSAADDLDQACYFPDHEYFFRWLNRSQPPRTPDRSPRSRVFTALNRLHKSWRAAVMADLVDQRLLDQSYWSYNTNMVMDDADVDNPLDQQCLPGWNDATERFLANGPYFCDGDDADSHNDHTAINHVLYQDSYCHIVFETLMDADGSGGCFLTEKTYKCIKYGQPFVIVGTAGSLAQLRRDGYRTFDHVIDSSYDAIQDNTARWLRLREIVREIAGADKSRILDGCLPDLIHNQRIFLDLQSQGLSRLIQRLR